MKKYVALIFTVAMMFLMIPATEVKAAAPAAPLDAAQTVSLEKGFRVQWTPVAGATQYYYSFSTDDKTYTPESPTGKNGTENFVNIVNKDVIVPGTYYYVRVRSYNGKEYSQYVKVKAASAPKAPTYIKQTAADSTTVTVSWDASIGASGYMVRFGTSAKKAKDIQIITMTSCKLKGLEPDQKYYVAIIPIKQVTDKFYASQNGVDTAKVVTTGGPVTGVSLQDWDVKNNVVMIKWDNTIKYESGYQIQLCDAMGKTIKTYTVKGKRTALKAISNKKLKNKPFRYRVRSYVTMSGVKQYGQWSAMAYAVPQANVTATKVSNSTVRLSWEPVEGATSYTIYRATKEGGTYKKLATTKKTAYRAKKLKTYKDYYFYVKVNKVLIGGKKRSSSKLTTPNDINVYIYKYQDIVCEE